MVTVEEEIQTLDSAVYQAVGRIEARCFMHDHLCSVSGRVIRTSLAPGRRCGPAFCVYVRYETMIYIEQMKLVNPQAWRGAVPI